MIIPITLHRRKRSVQSRSSNSSSHSQYHGRKLLTRWSIIINIKSTMFLLSIIFMYGSTTTIEKQNHHIEGYLPTIPIINCCLQSTFAYTIPFHHHHRHVQQQRYSLSFDNHSIHTVSNNRRHIIQKSTHNVGYSSILLPFQRRFGVSNPSTALHATPSSSSSSSSSSSTRTVGSSSTDKNENNKDKSDVSASTDSNTNHTDTNNNTASNTTTTTSTATPGDSATSSSNNTATDSKESSSTSTTSIGNDDKVETKDENTMKNEIENEAKKMKVGELKQILESQSISTRTFIEKSEFIKAYVQWKIDGGESTTSSSSSSTSTKSSRTNTNTNDTGTSSSSSNNRKQQQQQNKNDPQYRDVVIYKMNRNDPNMLQGTFIDVTIKSES